MYRDKIGKSAVSMRDLHSKAVLVTGAASGIGKATAVAFAREAANPLIICDIDGEGLQSTALDIQAMGCEVTSYTVDVSEFNAIKEMVDQVLERVGRIDILVNVAGWGLLAPLEKLDIADWRGVLEVNLLGCIHTVHSIYPHMVKRGSGHIVNISSVAGLWADVPFMAPYITSKFAVTGFSEALLLEASVHGIGVSCICPGMVNTPAYDAGPVKGFRPEAKEMGKALFRIAEEPEDTANSIVDAVKRNKFLVVTTPFMKVNFFIRRHFKFIWYPSQKLWARWCSRTLEKYRVED